MLETITADSPKLWKEDLLKIQQLGFNTVRTWVEWNIAEPEEGKYHLENLDLLLRLAHEAGLKVIVQVYADSAPEWVGRKCPDGRYAAQDGLPIPSQAASGYCFDNRGVRKAILDFFQEVARHAARNPAFYGWDLWSSKRRFQRRASAFIESSFKPQRGLRRKSTTRRPAPTCLAGLKNKLPMACFTNRRIGV